MGALLTAILQGAGRTGSELQQAKTANLQDKQQMEQFKLAMQELQGRLRQQGIQQQTEIAPQVVHTYRGSDGKIHNLVRNPLSGQISDQMAPGPGEFSTAQQKIADAEQALGRKLEPNEKDILVGLLPKPSAAQESIKVVNGVPVGIERGGKILTPGAPGWSAQDDVTWKQALASYAQGDVDKTNRIKLASQSRAWAWLQMPLAVFDVDSNSYTFASKAEIDKNPQKYGPPGPANQIVNQRRLFKEIDATVGLVNDSINKLPNDAFDADARLQIAMVLRDEQPRAAWYNFLNSAVATTLKPAQIDYVTGLVSLQESALSLRTLAGMGQGSDMLRGAIQKMLPGAGTPSKYFAQRQMKVFGVEVDALKAGIPNLGAPGRGTINQPTGPQKGEKKNYQGHEYTFDGKQWVRD